jgi:adenylate cyclase, class 2
MKLGGTQEIEVKLRVTHPPALRRRLARLGARGGPGARIHETNTLFDTPQGGLAKHGQLLRLRLEKPARKARGREMNSRAVLTYKGPAEKPNAAEAAQGKSFSATRGKRYKVREELEVVVADPQQLRLILEALGLRGWFRYEKYRTTYRLPASQRWAAGLHVELDETPIGNFVELEGPPEAIDRAAQLLGYRPADYISKTYLSLYLSQCRKQGVEPGDMLFPAK